MLLTRDEIQQDRSFGLLTDAILERDQPRTTDLFFQLVKRQGRSVGEALSVVTAAEAPFVQVPNHINVRDGQITLINNDHTILGLRTSTHLAPFCRSRTACCRSCSRSGTSRRDSTSGTSCSAVIPGATPP